MKSPHSRSFCWLLPNPNEWEQMTKTINNKQAWQVFDYYLQRQSITSAKYRQLRFKRHLWRYLTIRSQNDKVKKGQKQTKTMNNTQPWQVFNYYLQTQAITSAKYRQLRFKRHLCDTLQSFLEGQNKKGQNQ